MTLKNESGASTESGPPYSVLVYIYIYIHIYLYIYIYIYIYNCLLYILPLSLVEKINDFVGRDQPNAFLV